ncbi:N6-adenosine-methyltransferase catalytic subunit-like [Anneissia japonica]|uniref:N6-adenosine-methyltransferase catalytic subunit-like n=1 Tax=Anneissia japonica TaxID=1529436 RepID=UPI001425B5D8|nr:N6-adenosine-methyltransferase catalytic subunit-like [Anneissia japonica]
MSDTWSDIQAVKRRQENLRERLNRRKNERQNIALAGAGSAGSSSPSQQQSKSTDQQQIATIGPEVLSSGRPQTAADDNVVKQVPPEPATTTSKSSSRLGGPSSGTQGQPQSVGDNSATKPSISEVKTVLSNKAETVDKINPEIEKKLLENLGNHDMNLPIDSTSIHSLICKELEVEVSQIGIHSLLEKLAAQELIRLKESHKTDGSPQLLVTSVEHGKIKAMTSQEKEEQNKTGSRKRPHERDEKDSEKDSKKVACEHAPEEDDESFIKNLLSVKSFKEQKSNEVGKEIFDLLNMPTAKEQSLAEKFKSASGTVQEFCPHGTREDCERVAGSNTVRCSKLHFRRLINKHTDESLGDCSFLNTCFHMDTCKYVHYETEYPSTLDKITAAPNKGIRGDSTVTLIQPQWVQCDVRSLDMDVLGKFAVIMADPPWDIHMELPYGTMQDDEMRKLNVPGLQEEGFIFLWVTGRAMELGRECLQLWGYKQVDEIIWVKTNQLQRLIRTGRTGHWLNHGKEHCLVGVKGDPAGYNRGLDCDVIVAEVRETSHKPDEIYGLIERLSPGTRKIELFGRMHNVQPNWTTLGNQLDGVNLIEPDMIERFNTAYPDGNCMKPREKKPTEINKNQTKR